MWSRSVGQNGKRKSGVVCHLVDRTMVDAARERRSLERSWTAVYASYFAGSPRPPSPQPALHGAHHVSSCSPPQDSCTRVKTFISWSTPRRAAPPCGCAAAAGSGRHTPARQETSRARRAARGPALAPLPTIFVTFGVYLHQLAPRRHFRVARARQVPQSRAGLPGWWSDKSEGSRGPAPTDPPAA